MTYQIKKPDRLDTRIRRVAESQIDAALGDLEDEDRERAVHEARKRCKKLRALLRLARGPLEEGGCFSAENVCFREASRGLSGLRDAGVLRETYDALMEHFAEEVDRPAFAPVRRRLTERLKEMAGEEEGIETRTEDFRRAMSEARGRVPEWAPLVTGFGDLLPGLAKTYGRGRKAMKRARRSGSAGDFHDWRKRVKYHDYHCRLLRRAWPVMLKARRSELDRLADLLGDEHDLAVFRGVLESEADDFPGGTTRGALLGLIERRRESLRKESLVLGRRLFAVKSEEMAREWRQFGKAWRASV